VQTQPFSYPPRFADSGAAISDLRSCRRSRALTLIEVTLVIAILLGLISVLLVGFQAYRNGADRATCIQNIARVQQAMRSYSNINEHIPGDDVPSLKQELIGPARFFPKPPLCPAGGQYHFYGDGSKSGEPEEIPHLGVLYMSCSIVDHVPSSIAGW
jgi:hypothetical protein